MDYYWLLLIILIAINDWFSLLDTAGYYGKKVVEIFLFKSRFFIQYIYEFHKNFTSFHCTREDRNSTNWPRSQCVASQLSWLSISPVSQRSRVWIPFKPWYFQASSFQLLKLKNLLRWSLFTFTFYSSWHFFFKLRVSIQVEISLALALVEIFFHSSWAVSMLQYIKCLSLYFFWTPGVVPTDW